MNLDKIGNKLVYGSSQTHNNNASINYYSGKNIL